MLPLSGAALSFLAPLHIFLTTYIYTFSQYRRNVAVAIVTARIILALPHSNLPLPHSNKCSVGIPGYVEGYRSQK